jgi:hypothetical protein
MATNQNADYCHQLGHIFTDAAQQVGKFLYDHSDTLDDADKKILRKHLKSLTDYGNQFLTLSDQLAFSEAEPFLTQLCTESENIKKSLQKINQVNKIVAVSSGLVSVALGILTHNNGAIQNAAQSVFQALGSHSDQD